MKITFTHLLIMIGLLFGVNQLSLAQCGPGEDITSPIIACPGVVTDLTCASDLPPGYTTEAEYNNAFGSGMVSDNCEIASISYEDSVDPASFSFCIDEGPFVVTRTYTAVDLEGNLAICSYDINFDADTEAPVITAPANIPAGLQLTCDVDKDPYNLHITMGRGLPNITDQCKGQITEDQLAALPEVQNGWSVGEIISLNGMQISYSQNVVPHPGGICTDPNQRLYRIVREWSVIDDCNNSTSENQRINVVDNEVEPVAVTTSDKVSYFVDATCSVNIPVTDIESGSYDSCENDPLNPNPSFDVSATALIRLAGTTDPFGTELTLNSTNVDLSVACPAIINVEIQVEDRCGNTGTAIKEVSISDDTAPTLNSTPADLDVDGCDESAIPAPQLPFSTSRTVITEAEFVAAGGNVADSCGISEISYSDVLTLPACPGPIRLVTRTYSISDFCDNTTTSTQAISFLDVTPPTFDCPTNVTANTSDNGSGDCSTSVDGLAITNLMDDCSTDLTISYELTGATTGIGEGDASQELYNVGETIVNYTVTDCGNNEVTSCSVTVQVNDDENPVATCSEDLIFPTDNGLCTTTINYDTLGTDNCTENSNLSFTIDDGPLPGTSQAPGTYNVTYTVTDEAGLTDQCSFSITVEDQEAPVINCQNDTIINLDTLQCGIIYTFIDPEVNDNCTDPTDITLTRVDATGIVSGDELGIGEYIISYTAMDISGNSDTCSYTVTINEFQNVATSCNKKINLSLDESCTASLLPEMVVTGTQYGCIDSCDIFIYNEDGDEIPNLFSTSDLGNTYLYSVCCGGVCCEGQVLIEDKFKPQLVCVDITLTCEELINYPTPEVIDNCDDTEAILVTESIVDVSCTDPLIDRILTRKFYAKDSYGNVSDTCEQTLRISKFDISTVTAPNPGIFTLECESNYPKDQFGNPSPLFYGEPTLGGRGLYSNQFLACNVMVTYEDDIYTVAGSIFITRNWKVVAWSCSGDQEIEFKQLFEIKDSTGPDVICFQDLTFSTNSTSCTAIVTLDPIEATDLCNDVVEVDIEYEGGFLNNQNGGTVELPVGTTDVTYFVKDTYGNVTECTFNVTVFDDVEPIALAKQVTKVSLGTDGTGTVLAESIDLGSFDECSDVQVFVKRMDNGGSCDPLDLYEPAGNDNTQFNEAVHFCCADIGETIMVQFKACDDADNDGFFGGYNDLCSDLMVEVMVEDKIPPTLLADLPDITISCEFPIDLNNLEVFGKIVNDINDRDSILLTADSVAFSSAPIDGLIYDNCGNLVNDELDGYESFNQCGTGTLYRFLTYGESNGATTLITQKITVVNPSPFDDNDIQWPADYFASSNTTNCGDLNAFLPDNLPANFARPIVQEDNCDMVAFTYSDVVSDFSNGSNSCLAIQRTWEIADWCQTENDQFKTWTHVQELTISNYTAPTITGDCSNKSFETLDADCSALEVTLSNSATDDCTKNEDLNWTYQIDMNNDGEIDVVGIENSLTLDFEVGTHLVNWSVNDGCGNETVCSYTIEVNNVKAPTAIAFDDLAYELGPMDSDGDGTPDFEGVEVFASYFNNGSYHTCGYDITVSFSADVNDTTRVYDCDDIGVQELQMWVTDENGNQSYVNTTVQIQNNTGEACPPSPFTYNISGHVMTDQNEMMDEVHVKLEGGEIVDFTEDGVYTFGEVAAGNAYQVNPTFADDAINGVTTLDIVMIQKHILQIELLESPYKMIAADINNSGNITGTDIIQLRKLLLGFYNDFPLSPSWKFIDAEHEFSDPSNPWSSNYPEKYDINNLQENMLIDFYGVKIGDVNHSAHLGGLKDNDVDTRDDNSLEFNMHLEDMIAGSNVMIPVTSSNFIEVVGFQMTLDYSPTNFEIINIHSEHLNMDNKYAIANGKVNISWNNLEPLHFSEEEELFYIEIRTNRNIASESNIITLSENGVKAEYYNNNLDINGIVLNSTVFEHKVDNEFENLVVKQNEPNPWSSETTIIIDSAKKGEATFRIMTATGQVIHHSKLQLEVGQNEVILTNKEFETAGIMYYEITMGDKTVMKKMVRIN